MPHCPSLFTEFPTQSPDALRVMEKIRSYCATTYATGDVACTCLDSRQLIRTAFGLPSDAVIETSPYAPILSTAPCYSAPCFQQIRGQTPPTYISHFLAQIQCPDNITVCNSLNSGNIGGSLNSMCGSVVATVPVVTPVPGVDIPKPITMEAKRAMLVICIAVGCILIFSCLLYYFRVRVLKR